MRCPRIIGVIAAIGWVLATGAAAQSPISFPSGPVPFARGDAVPPTVLFKPEQGVGPWSVVVLLPTCAGVSYAQFDWAERLLRAGRMALILDSYTPRNVRDNCQGADAPVTQRMMADDVAAAIAWARRLPMVKPDRFAVVGFSWGAMAATKLSVGRLQGRLTPPIIGLRAVAAFYPGCGTDQPNPSTRAIESYDWGGDVSTPLMLFLGAIDNEAPSRFCTAKADRARSRGQPVSYKVYENTTHAFDSRLLGSREIRKNLSGNRGIAVYRYNPVATEDSAAQLLAFLATNLD